MQNKPCLSSEQLQKAREYVAGHRNINWYSDPYQLKGHAIVEGVLNYGTWEDFQYLFSTFGGSAFKTMFQDLTSDPRLRTNIRPQATAFFRRYLEKHV